MKKILFLSLIALVFAVPCFASDPQEVSDEAEYPSNVILKEQLDLKDFTIRIYTTDEALDTSLLINDTKLEGAISLDSIKENIDNLRNEYYPDAEIILEIENKATPDLDHIWLRRAVFWWNNVNFFGRFWWWRAHAEAVACFTNVQRGRYLVSWWLNGAWRPRANVAAGGAWTGSTFGPLTSRGCRGDGRLSVNQANIVMYFYFRLH